jgi:hypothetical protein
MMNTSLLSQNSRLIYAPIKYVCTGRLSSGHTQRCLKLVIVASSGTRSPFCLPILLSSTSLTLKYSVFNA